MHSPQTVVALDHRSIAPSPARQTEVERTADHNFTLAAQRLRLSADQQHSGALRPAKSGISLRGAMLTRKERRQ